MIRYLLIIGALIGLSWYSVERYYDSRIIAVVSEATEAELAGDHEKSASLLAHAKNKFGRNSIDTLISHVGSRKAPVLEKQLCQRLLGELSMEYSRGSHNSAASVALLNALDKSFDIDYELLDFVAAVKLSESRDPSDRLAAVRAIGFLKKKDGLRKIKVLLDDPYWLVRVEALKSLSKIKDNSLLPKVIEMLTDPVSEVQAEAALVGTQMSAGNYSGDLFKGLEKLSENDFPAAAKAYGQMNDSKVYQILKEKMTAIDPKVSVIAAAALARLGDKDGMDFMRKSIVAGEPELRSLASTALNGLEGDEVSNMLIIASGDSEVTVRISAITSLGHCQGTRVLSALKAALSDKDGAVQVATLTALGNTGKIQAGEIIYSSLSTSRATVVKAAVDSLVKLEDEGAIPHLEKLLNSDFREHRLLARNGLKKLSGKDYIVPD